MFLEETLHLLFVLLCNKEREKGVVWGGLMPSYKTTGSDFLVVLAFLEE